MLDHLKPTRSNVVKKLWYCGYKSWKAAMRLRGVLQVPYFALKILSHLREGSESFELNFQWQLIIIFVSAGWRFSMLRDAREALKAAEITLLRVRHTAAMLTEIDSSQSLVDFGEIYIIGRLD